jgi:hypothetical protein
MAFYRNKVEIIYRDHVRRLACSDAYLSFRNGPPDMHPIQWVYRQPIFDGCLYAFPSPAEYP